MLYLSGYNEISAAMETNITTIIIFVIITLAAISFDDETIVSSLKTWLFNDSTITLFSDMLS